MTYNYKLLFAFALSIFLGGSCASCSGGSINSKKEEKKKTKSPGKETGKYPGPGGSNRAVGPQKEENKKTKSPEKATGNYPDQGGLNEAANPQELSPNNIMDDLNKAEEQLDGEQKEAKIRQALETDAGKQVMENARIAFTTLYIASPYFLQRTKRNLENEQLPDEIKEGLRTRVKTFSEMFIYSVLNETDASSTDEQVKLQIRRQLGPYQTGIVALNEALHTNTENAFMGLYKFIEKAARKN